MTGSSRDGSIERDDVKAGDPHILSEKRGIIYGGVQGPHTFHHQANEPDLRSMD